jgi:hypothetical protein
LCKPVSEFHAQEDRSAQRGRSLLEEIPTIVGYPFRDPVAFVLLALFTGFFAWFSWISIFAGLLSYGVLVWYGFTALSHVSRGNMKSVMPDFSDISDLIEPLRLALATIIVSAAPLFVGLILLIGSLNPMDLLSSVPMDAQLDPSMVTEDVMDPTFYEEDGSLGGGEESDAYETEPFTTDPFPMQGSGGIDSARLGVAGMALLLILGALLWNFVYTPVALTVAGVSRSFFKTLVITVVQFVSGAVLGFIPILGTIAQAFVNAYAWLAIGCTLGLAVFKKAPELGLD